MKWHTASVLGIAAIAQAAQVHFSLDLTWAVGSPNGFEREMIFVNGQFPGPALVLDEGDDVVIDVTNHLPFNTSIHYHGIEQKGTPWADGVAGLSQWAIQPGQSYTYKWTADTYGTYWYHAHDKSAIMDGLYGAIYIRPRKDRDSPFAMISDDPSDIKAMKRAERDGQLVVLSDWDHLTSEEYMGALRSTGYDIFCTDSVLINGHGSVFCNDPEVLTRLLPPPVARVVNGTLTDKGCLPFVRPLQGDWEHHPEKLPPGLNDGCKPSTTQDAIFRVNADDRWASFHVISAASLKVLVLSFDEHPMYVYEVDGRYIEPQLAHSMTLYNGERYSVMIQLDREPANYKVRVANSAGNQIISGFATMSYRGGELSLRASQPYIDYASANVTADVVPLNTDQLPPYPAITPAAVADDFHLLTLRRINSAWQWTLDGTTFLPGNLGALSPAILDPQAPELASALKISTKNNTWVDIVFQLQVQDPTPVQPPHPLHKHSNKAFILGNGLGKFQWGSIEEAKQASPNSFLKTPIYRDTFVTSPRGEAWTAIRYHVENPGPFLLHCHMETHLASGMGLVLLDGVDAWPAVDAEQITPV
ncbi:laccase abr2 [Aspergillus clavatus NRRL 1]|uniref:Conidial pigment biosynthesis oxidase Arb2/brown2 n=1 Tax=Aspergillus clavatus (strain ATCC 1007 / CBS 513.65 / DSM 816 / NCTC 3887 / NRRL 1 / QM 1276 / 107) TaxID=344612 RepID=A1C883_ASPCL|nr:conidial pigment biosynthesis oxidase Arb2/brown2 [Aspergillus clavatus NRRL 1]EAW14604.1 conidial pigment biosynthesis oxidase Arb2/brown2 [Aspergillus clavatus NRRL 1]